MFLGGFLRWDVARGKKRSLCLEIRNLSWTLSLRTSEVLPVPSCKIEEKMAEGGVGALNLWLSKNEPVDQTIQNI